MAGTRTHVDPSNTAQAEAWDGDEGAYWAQHAERFDAAVAAYDPPFLDAAGIGSADAVLDIGCGTGHTTRDAARAAPSGSAFGIDLSSQMIELARRLATDEGVTNASFEQTDAQIHPFEPGAFDVAISRTGSMFFSEPVAAFANLGRSLRADGRVTLLTWQPPPHNEWFVAFSTAMAAGRDLPAPPPGAPGPFSLSDPERIRSVLTDAGFVDITVVGLREPMVFGANAEDAFAFVLGLLGWMLEGLDGDGRARALDALRTTMTAHDREGRVAFDSATWLITARNVQRSRSEIP